MTFLDDLIKLSPRLDGWRSTVSGLGVLGMDRAVSTSFAPCGIDDQTLEDLYHYNDLAALIVDIYPEEALRRGFAVEGLAPEVLERWKEKLLVRETLQEGARWGRLYGLAIATIGAEDGRPLCEPLDLSAPRRVDFLEVFDRRQITPVSVGGSLLSRAPVFRVSRQNGSQFEIHRSRCLVFGGSPTSKRIREGRSGADLSVLQRPYEILRDYGSGFLALGNLLTDASTPVITMRGIVAGLAGDKRQALVNRLEFLNVSRSIARALFLDSSGDEKFEKVSTSFTGIPETIDRLTGRLSVATGIPVERLGQALAGLNATGESSTRAWYDRVESFRETSIEPPLRYLARVELGPEVKARVSFPPFWQPTAAEAAATAKANIDAAALLYDREAIQPEELAQLAASVGVKINPNVPRQVAAPTAPVPGPVATADVETAPQGPNHAADLAADMTARQVEACQHGRSNRCPLCGIERLRGIEGVGPDGAPIWKVAWRAMDSHRTDASEERTVRVKAAGAPGADPGVIVLRLKRKAE